jgi:hypothetical protein
LVFGPISLHSRAATGDRSTVDTSATSRWLVGHRRKAISRAAASLQLRGVELCTLSACSQRISTSLVFGPISLHSRAATGDRSTVAVETRDTSATSRWLVGHRRKAISRAAASLQLRGVELCSDKGAKPEHGQARIAARHVHRGSRPAWSSGPYRSIRELQPGIGALALY